MRDIEDTRQGAHARLANGQSQIPQGTVVSIAFLAGATVPILVRAAAFVRQLGPIETRRCGADRYRTGLPIHSHASRIG